MKQQTDLEFLLSLMPDPETRERFLVLAGRSGLAENDIQWQVAAALALSSGLPTQAERERLLSLPDQTRDSVAPFVARAMDLVKWLAELQKEANATQKQLSEHATLVAAPLHELVANLNAAATATGTIAREHVQIREGWEKSLRLGQAIQTETVTQAAKIVSQGNRQFGLKLISATALTILLTTPLGVLAGVWLVSKMLGGAQ